MSASICISVAFFEINENMFDIIDTSRYLKNPLAVVGAKPSYISLRCVDCVSFRNELTKFYDTSCLLELILESTKETY